MIVSLEKTKLLIPGLNRNRKRKVPKDYVSEVTEEEETLTVKERSSVHSGAQGEDISVEPDKERDSRDPGSTPYRKSQLNRAEETLSKVESSEESQGT